MALNIKYQQVTNVHDNVIENHNKAALQMNTSKAMKFQLLETCSLLLFVQTGDSARILLLPLAFTSHLSQMTQIGNELASKGHELYMLLTPNFPGIQKWDVSDYYFLMIFTYIHILIL